jgi:putative transcriptional regulator
MARNATLPIVTSSEIKALRALLGMTQAEFAARYYIPVKTLQGWEQGRRALDPASSAYLHLVAFNPDAAASALLWVAARAAREP